jgi:hypothetical protein
MQQKVAALSKVFCLQINKLLEILVVRSTQPTQHGRAIYPKMLLDFNAQHTDYIKTYTGCKPYTAILHNKCEP